jgi:3-deoxy-7-phosphoheptulonate synthase
MIVTLKSGAKKKEIDQVLAKIKELGFRPQVSQGAERVVIGVIGEGNKAVAHKDSFESMPQVEMVTPISRPYKLVSREFKKDNTIVDIRGVKIGGKNVVIMAGPCSVDTRELVMTNAKELKKACASCAAALSSPGPPPMPSRATASRGFKSWPTRGRPRECRSSPR